MNKIIINTIFGALFLLFFCACTKTKENFPGDYIYLVGPPKNINIPNQENTYYSIDSINDVLNIDLHVVGYGAAGNGNITVTVASDQDTINQLIQTKELDATAVTPQLFDKIFNFPTQINIGVGGEAIIPISVNLKKVPADANKLALAIKISNPSKFFVYPAYTTAVIVINYKTIHNGLYGEIGVLENLNDRAFLAVNNNNLTISHDSAYWNIIKVGNNVLIKNLETGKYIKHAGNYMDNGFTLGTYDSSDVFLLNIDEVSAHYNLNGYKAYVIGDKHITTCIDSYGNGTIGAWSYSEAVQGIFPNRVWVFFDK